MSDDPKIPTQSELEKELPQPPLQENWNKVTAGIIAFGVVLLSFIGWIGRALGWWVIIFMLGVNVRAQTNNLNGLQLWWTLDENTGTVAHDLSGNGYNGTLTGSPTWISAVITNGVSFSSASSQSITASGPATSFNGVSAATLCFWANTTNKFSVGFSDTANKRFFITLGSANTLYYVTENGFLNDPSETFVADTNWHWFAMVFNAGVVTPYIDGVIQHLSSGGPPSTLSSVLGNFTVARNVGASLYYTMEADDIRLYNRALTQGEITNQYQWPVGNRPFPSPPAGAAYFIKTNGNDSLSGLTVVNAWQHPPHSFHNGTNVFTGTYTAADGDQFIFEGNDVFSNIFPTYITHANTYVGVSNGFYFGASWGPPIFEGNSIGFSLNNDFVYIQTGKSNVTVDSFVMQHLYWDSTSGALSTGYIYIGKNTNTVIENCKFLNWSHDTAGNGASDVLEVIEGDTGGYNPGGLLANCIIDGGASGKNSGQAVYCFHDVVNCFITNIACGVLPNGKPCIVSGCTIVENGSSFSGKHGAAIEAQGPTGNQYFYNNIIHDSAELNIMVGGSAGVTGTAYIWQNIVYNSTPGCVLLSWFSGSSNIAYIFGNVLDASQGGSYCILAENGTWVAMTNFNNFFIGGTTNSGSYTLRNDGWNLNMTSAQATAAGYVSSNLYYPPSALAPTIGVGTNLTSLGLYSTDLNGNNWPAITPWNVAMYVYTNTAPPPPPALTIISVPSAPSTIISVPSSPTTLISQ